MTQTIQDVFPKPYRGIQVNYCVSAGCKNFGNSDPALYRVVPNNRSLNIYHCPECGAYPQMIDNRSVSETIDHQKRYHALSLTACPDSSCANHRLAVHAFPERYRSFGKTSSLRQRYQCRACQSVFTDKLCCINPHSEVQTAVFYGMMYSFGVRNICNKLGITPKSFYRHQWTMVERLQYIAHVKEADYYRQPDEACLATSYRFAGENEGAMLVATAHQPSGYIVAFDTNIVGGMAESCLLKTSTEPLLSRPAEKTAPEPDILTAINARYEAIMARKNYLDPTSDGRLVIRREKTGLMQPYLACFAHALVLRQKMQQKTKRCYFVEQDTLLRNAYINASLDDLLKSDDHLFYYRENHQPMAGFDSDTLHLRSLGWWQDRWGILSLPDKTKAACHIKGQHLSREKWRELLEANTLDHVNHYLLGACEFLQGLGALNEQSLNDWLHIYTGYYNFCSTHRQGKTPAQLLGLSHRALTLGELLGAVDLE